MSYPVLASKLKALAETLTKNESKLESAALAKAATAFLGAADKFEAKLNDFLHGMPAKSKKVAKPKAALPKGTSGGKKLSPTEVLQKELLRLGLLNDDEFDQELAQEYGKKKELEELADANSIKYPEKPTRDELIKRIKDHARRSAQNVRI